MKLGDIARLDGVNIPACWKKQRWKSEGAANAQLRSLFRFDKVKDVDALNVYQCKHCQGWHVGRLPQRRQDGTDLAG